MEKLVKHRFLNSMLFTALFVPLGFFLLRDTIAAITGIMFESIGGKESFLYQINDDIARLIIVGLLMLIMPIFFRTAWSSSAAAPATRSFPRTPRLPCAPAKSMRKWS